MRARSKMGALGSRHLWVLDNANALSIFSERHSAARHSCLCGGIFEIVRECRSARSRSLTQCMGFQGVNLISSTTMFGKHKFIQIMSLISSTFKSTKSVYISPFTYSSLIKSWRGINVCTLHLEFLFLFIDKHSFVKVQVGR